jgi:hypothetical protein
MTPPRQIPPHYTASENRGSFLEGQFEKPAFWYILFLVVLAEIV